MKIAWFGSSLVSSYWSGPAAYYRGLIRALAARGHRVTFFEPEAYERQQHRDIDDPSWAKVAVYDPDKWRRAVKRARGADVVVKASGIGVRDTELEEAVLELGAAVSVFLDVDPAATLAAPSERFRSLVPEFDVVLTHGGGQPVCDRYRALGARDCVPVYNAVDPATHYPVPPSERYASDLTLIADRQEWVEELLFEAAVQLPEHDFLLGGAGWADTPLPGNVQRLGHVASADHNLLNSSALAVLVVTRPDLAQLGWSPPTRLFEAAGAAACLITDDWPGIEDFLEPEVEVLVARGAAEVVQHLLELTPERARAIGSAARERVLAQHTYAHRAELVESALASVHAGRAL